MNRVHVTIWGRELELEVKYDCYDNEEITTTQKEALEDILNNSNSLDSSLEELKQYCLSNNKEEIGADDIENIFKYVAPKYLYVVRDNEKHIVALMCNYRFDSENGIVILFENEKLSKIGKQDIVL